MARPRTLKVLGQIVGSTYLLIGAIVVAAMGLAYYSYEYAKEMARQGEQSIVDNTHDAALERLYRIDNMLLDSDQVLFNLVDVENLKEFRRRWGDFGHLLGTVESVVVLDEHLQIAPDGFASKKRKADVDAFRKLFDKSILRDLGLATLQDKEVHHLHKQYDGRYYLLSATRRDVAGRTFYIVLEADIYHLVGDIFPDVFARDSASRMVQIVDERGNLVFGHSFSNIPSKYLVSLVFPKTLYLWRLRMTPRDVPDLVARELARRASDWIFVGLSSVTLFVGLGILTYAVRAERRANQLKSDFVANVSHELKTPLSLIQMFGEILASGRTKTPESAREYAEIITRESERLSRLIDNVLDFARIERGKVAYDMKIGDLADVLSRGLDVYRHRLEREGMRLTVNIAADLPRVRLDENAMMLVLLNLVDNAVKYAAEGKELRVALEREGDRVKLSVVDRGPGIEPEERERIFERFYRARKARGRPARGSGIGLAIVKNVAEAHGGDVTVESAPGGGSAFIVTLPIAAPAAISATSPAAEPRTAT